MSTHKHRLTKKHTAFIKAYVECWDITQACETAGCRSFEIMNLLMSESPLTMRLRQEIQAKKLSHEFMDESCLRNAMYKLAMDEQASATVRVRAATLWLGTQDGKALKNNEVTERFNEVMGAVGKTPNADLTRAD